MRLAYLLSCVKKVNKIVVCKDKLFHELALRHLISHRYVSSIIAAHGNLTSVKRDG